MFSTIHQFHRSCNHTQEQNKPSAALQPKHLMTAILLIDSVSPISAESNGISRPTKYIKDENSVRVSHAATKALQQKAPPPKQLSPVNPRHTIHQPKK